MLSNPVKHFLPRGVFPFRVSLEYVPPISGRASEQQLHDEPLVVRVLVNVEKEPDIVKVQVDHLGVTGALVRGDQPGRLEHSTKSFFFFRTHSVLLYEVLWFGDIL